MARTAATEELTDRLERAGLKPTVNRLAVLEALSAEPNDATAQRVHHRLVEDGGSIGLATVYRALAAMSDAGVVDVLPHAAGESCYRLCSDAHHHHLVCESCHLVVELRGCPAEDWIAKGARREGFAVSSHRLEVTGLCPECRRGAGNRARRRTGPRG